RWAASPFSKPALPTTYGRSASAARVATFSLPVVIDARVPRWSDQIEMTPYAISGKTAARASSSAKRCAMRRILRAIFTTSPAPPRPDTLAPCSLRVSRTERRGQKPWLSRCRDILILISACEPLVITRCPEVERTDYVASAFRRRNGETLADGPRALLPGEEDRRRII